MSTPDDSTLTAKQQFWLNHIKRAASESLSLAEYAKREGLELQTLYSYKNMLRKKGFFGSTQASPFTQVTHAPRPMLQSAVQAPLQIVLNNGVRIDIATKDINITELLKMANQL